MSIYHTMSETRASIQNFGATGKFRSPYKY